MITASGMNPRVAAAFRRVLDRYRHALAHPGHGAIPPTQGVVDLEAQLCMAATFDGLTSCRACPLGPQIIGCVLNGFLDSVFHSSASKDVLARRYFVLRGRAAEIGFRVNPRLETADRAEATS